MTRGLGRTLRERALRVAELAATPLVPSDYLDVFNPLRAGAELRGRVVSVIPETEDAATLVIKPGADWAGHIPGQYVRLGIDVDGVRLWRAYSLTHGPREDGYISITVKAVPYGKVSNHIVRDTRPGTLVHLEQAAGEFVLPTEGGKFLFVTAGSGITPVIGMLRNLFPVAESGVVRLQRSSGYDITVVHVAPTEPDSIFIHNLRELAEAGDHQPRRPLRRPARRPQRAPGRAGARPDRAHHVRLRTGRAANSSNSTTWSSASSCSPSSSGATLAVQGGTVSFATGTTVEASGSRPSSRRPRTRRGVLMPAGAGWASATAACSRCVTIPETFRTGDITIKGDGVRVPDLHQRCRRQLHVRPLTHD